MKITIVNMFIDFIYDNAKYTVGVLYRKPDSYVDDIYTETIRK